MKIRYEMEMDTTRLGAALREKRGHRAVREVVDESGMTLPTFSRLEHGGTPELATFYQAMRWLNIPSEEWEYYIDKSWRTPK